MRSKLLDLRILCSIAAAAILVFAGAANPQTERTKSVAATETAIQVGTVTRGSPAVNLNAIGREVAPGVFEIEPSSIRGRRITVPRGDLGARVVCIGRWKNGECKGIYIEW